MKRNENLPFIFLDFLQQVCNKPCSTLLWTGVLSGTWVYLEVGGRCGIGNRLENVLTLLND